MSAPQPEPKAKTKVGEKTKLAASLAGGCGLVEVADLMASDLYQEALSYPMAWRIGLTVGIRGLIFGFQNPQLVQSWWRSARGCLPGFKKGS